MTEIAPLDTNEIIPGNNDRTTFAPEALQDLASSIQEHGLIQPITVRWLDDAGSYQIIAGERRFRACADILGWQEVPAIIADATDEEAAAIMLAENVARADLDPIDEALAYQSRIDAFGWTVKEIAQRAGVSSIRVQFRIKLLQLRPEIQKLVRDGQILLGYAQVLSGADLDTNRQLIAIARLRDNPSPTPAWFRRQVNELLAQQMQDSLFDLSAIAVQQERPATTAYVKPAHPSTTKPPSNGGGIKAIIQGQVEFWTHAASQWDELGKPFKRQECEAAARALSLAIAAF